MGVIWNCSAATDMVSWLQTMWVLAQVWGHALNFLTHPSSKSAMAWHWWAIKISWDTITPVIGPKDLIWNCLAATDNMVSWLQTMWVLAQVWGHEQLKMCHGLALMGHQNLLGHHHTNHWSHRCNMKLFGSNRYGVMTANNVSFVSGLRYQRTENQNFAKHHIPS
jgi:hypothetical protein